MCKKTKIVIFILTLIFIAPLGLYFFAFRGILSEEHSRWAEFGSYASGIYGTLAFLILAYTANINRNQFRKQNEDNVFFRLYESLQNRINASTAFLDGEEHKAHQVLKLVARRLHEELSKESITVAKLLLCKSPEKISDTHYFKIFDAIKWGAIDSFQQDKDIFIAEMNSQKDFNARWEKLKYYIGSTEEEGEEVREALRATGSVHFYNLQFEERQHRYDIVFQRLSDEYGEFLDGYCKNICFLVQYAAKASNAETYMDFIKSQLSKYELVILFYMVVGNEVDAEQFREFYNNGIFDGMLETSCTSLMIDFPSSETIEQELEFIFKKL